MDKLPRANNHFAMGNLEEIINPKLPEGTVTFLFTDIEGSTHLLHQLGSKYITLLSDHHRLLRSIFAKWHGREVDTEGDAFFVSFVRATEAVAAVVEAQRALAEHTWPDGVAVRVRMGIHTGEPWTGSEGYVGMDVHRAARIAHVGYGGQVLLSETAAALVRDVLPDDVELLDLGRHILKDLQVPEHIRQLVIPDLPSEFPPLKSLRTVEPEDLSHLDPAPLPAFLKEHEPEPAPPVFVARERELARLSQYLDLALQFQGQVAFVSGDAGSGKTALLHAFACQAQNQQPDLLVAWGNCNAFTGQGDPYLPFRDVLTTLTGEVEARWQAGAITTQQARLLWRTMPMALQSLVDCGPDLIDTFIPGSALVARASAALPVDSVLLAGIKQQVSEERTDKGQMKQPQLFEQVAQMLGTLGESNAVLLLLDDLQWADSGSTNLLFHLSRRLQGKRILLVGAYRPEEVAAGRDGQAHPLRPVMDELRRTFGDIWLDLNQTQDRLFVDAFLDSESNRLDESFRATLFGHTRGHPLFTVELLRDLQERGDLVRAEDGCWTAGPNLQWETIPSRIEGVIAARIGRLEEELRGILTVAAVEGEDFTAQVIAKVQHIQERLILKTLSQELARRHRLVKELSAVQQNRLLIARYRFAHALFQRYLYNQLGEGERRLLHSEIAEVLEALYTEREEEIAVQLARHYDEAGQGEKALPYMLQAGDKARRLYAFKDASQHYERALALMMEQGDYERASRILMKMGLTYHGAFEFRHAQQAYEESFRIRQQMVAWPSPKPVHEPPHALRTATFRIDNLDPNDCGSGYTTRVITQLFSSLVRLTPEWDLMPDVAQRWEVLDGGRTYVFHLRDDVFWSDGFPVTAGDFQFAWQRMVEQKQVSLRNFMDIAKSGQAEGKDSDPLLIEALNEYTLQVRLEQPNSYFLQIIGLLAPLPQHTIDVYGEAWLEPENLVTNGPFQLESWQPGKRMVLRRNPTYHERFSGNVEMIELLFADGPVEILALYEADALDILAEELVPPMEWRQAVRQHAGDYLTGPKFSTLCVWFDTTRPPLDDRRVRRALVLATNRHTMANVFEMGNFLPATGGFVPPGMPGHAAGIALPTDLDRARRLLAKAGYPDGKGLPEVTALSTKGNETIPEAVLKPWQIELGFKISWELYEFEDYLQQIDDQPPHLWFHSWGADYLDPDNFLRVGLHKNCNWQDETFLEIVEEARRILNQAERMRLYRRAEEILVEEAPFFPLLYRREHRLVKPWIRNYQLPAIDVEFWQDIIIDPH